MPEVVFDQPLRRLTGSLMASSVGWLTDLLALSGSFSIFGSGGWGRVAAR